MAVPCLCGAIGAVSASKLAAMLPASSAFCASIAESMTATRTSSPLASACACGRCSLASAYCAGSPAARRRVIRLHGEQIIRLRRGDEIVALERAHHRRHRAAVGNAPAEQSGAGQLERLRLEAGQPMPPLQGIDLRRAHRIANFDHHLVRHQPPLACRRRAARPAPRAALPARRAVVADDVVVVDERPAGRQHPRHRHDHAGHAPAGAALATARPVIAARSGSARGRSRSARG